MVCLELEDGVARAEKEIARDNMIRFFNARPSLPSYPEILVRINAPEEQIGKADLDSVLRLPVKPAALMIPKVRQAGEVIELDKKLANAAPDLALHLLIETAEALENASAIAAASQRIKMLLFGGVDLATELRATTGWEALLYARGRVAHAGALAGLDLMDMPYLAIEDEKGIVEEAIRARDMGFGGKAAIHPKQIAAINKAFTPTAEDISQAKKIMAAYANAPRGVVVVDGKLVEKPVILKMQYILAIADAVGA
jgi:citrate lyase beta subunit